MAQHRATSQSQAAKHERWLPPSLDHSDAPLPYYARLIADVFERTETAMPQAHCFKVCELALAAQAHAVRLA
jgi:hypothetical protein